MSSVGMVVLLNKKRAVHWSTGAVQIHQTVNAVNKVLASLLQEAHRDGLQINSSWLHVLSERECHPLIRTAVEKYGFQLHENVSFRSGEALRTLYDESTNLPDVLILGYPNCQFLGQLKLLNPQWQSVWTAHDKDFPWRQSARHILLPGVPTYKDSLPPPTEKVTVLLDVENMIAAHASINQQQLRDLFIIIQATSEWLEKRGLVIDRQHSVACLRPKHPETNRIRQVVEFFGIKLRSPGVGEPAERKLDFHSFLLLREHNGFPTVLVMSGDGDLYPMVADLQRDNRYVVLVSWLAHVNNNLRKKADEFVSLQDIFEETGFHCLPPVSRTELVC